MHIIIFLSSNIFAGKKNNPSLLPSEAALCSAWDLARNMSYIYKNRKIIFTTSSITHIHAMGTY